MRKTKLSISFVVDGFKSEMPPLIENYWCCGRITAMQMKTLLAKGANPNALLPEYGISPFHRAVANESVPFAVQATDICLQHGADPNVRSEDGLTPVHLAAMWGCAEVLGLLLVSGGDPWLVDCFDLNALDYAHRENQPECAALLTAKSWQLNQKRVVLDQNDLEIVYEASPLTSLRCASTQTPLLDQKTDLNMDRNEEKDNFACTLKRWKNYKKDRVCENSMTDSSTNTPQLSREHMDKDRQVFEYSPPRQESFSSCVESWKGAGSYSLQSSNMVSELVDKSEKANKLRQPLKNIKSLNLKNVTQRKKLQPTPEVEPVSNSECSYESFQRDIGFILDNLDEISKERGSSLFSDIDTDVDVTRNVHNSQTLDTLITDDESSSEDRRVMRCASSYFIYPNLQRCLDNVSNSVEESLTPKVTDAQSNFPRVHSISSSIDSMMESILANIDENKSTPVNNRLITSTPETEELSDVSSSGSDVDTDDLRKALQEFDFTPGPINGSTKRVYLRKLKRFRRNPRPPTPQPGLPELSDVSSSGSVVDTDDLRKALQEFGLTPGPINGSTKRVYLRKLKRFRRKPRPPTPPPGLPAYSPELLRTLTAPCGHLLSEWAHLEDSMTASFTCNRRPRREGQAKTSFTYLLIDPRLAHDLPRSALPPQDLWPHFLRAVFYVGKGKGSRPYTHLQKAVTLGTRVASRNFNSCKIQRILDIWSSGAGVICLHVFHNLIPVEAYTREAAMISALTLTQVTNEKAGEFYGSAASWSAPLKRRLGSVLLYRALRVFLAEGERQLWPADLV